jgi:hypothetical protein
MTKVRSYECTSQSPWLPWLPRSRQPPMRIRRIFLLLLQRTSSYGVPATSFRPSYFLIKQTQGEKMSILDRAETLLKSFETLEWNLNYLGLSRSRGDTFDLFGLFCARPDYLHFAMATIVGQRSEAGATSHGREAQPPNTTWQE